MEKLKIRAYKDFAPDGAGGDRGNVVGVVSAKLSARAALSASGALPENVNYAVKSSFLLGFLESVPELSAKLKEPETRERKFEEELISRFPPLSPVGIFSP